MDESPIQSQESGRMPSFQGNRYEGIQLLGAGGGGSVFRAYDTDLSKQVAIKLLAGDWNESQFMRFQREAKTLAKLKHRGIASILDFGIDAARQPYMVLDLVPGVDLKHYMHDGLLEEGLALVIVQQVCKALEHAHSKGVVHRDMKPHNIIVDFETEKPNVVVVDFGIAKILDEHQPAATLSQNSMILGSPLYMSPEQARHEPVTPLSDIYSLGCVLFEMLCGRPPFEGETAIETATMHAFNVAPRISEVAPDQDYSVVLEEIVARCLEKSPEQRYQSVSELHDEVSHVLAALYAEPINTTAIEEAPKRFIAKGISPPVLIVLSLLLLGVGVFSFFSLNEKPRVLPPMEVPPTIQRQTEERRGHEATPDFEIENDLKNPTLKKLEYAGISDATLERFSQHRNLEQIWIKSSPEFTGTAFAKLESKGIYRVLLNDCPNLDSEALSVLASYPRLVAFDYSENSVDPKVLRVLKTIPNLKVLDLKECQMRKEESWRALNQLTGLTSLNLEACPQLTDARFKDIRGLKNINRLQTSATEITGSGFKDLNCKDKLVFLALHNCRKLSVDGIASLKDFPKLSILQLNHDAITPELLTAIRKNVVALSSLHLKSCDLSTESFEALARFSNLRFVSLADSTLHDDDVSLLSAMKSLKEIDVHDTNVTEEGLLKLRTEHSGIRTIPLTVEAPHEDSKGALIVEDDKAGDEAVKMMRKKSYREIEVDGGDLTANFFKALAAQKNLTVLSLTRVFDEDLRQYRHLKTVKTLKIKGSDLTGEAFDSLAMKDSLAQLNLIACPKISVAGLGQLKNYPNLSHIKFEHGSVSADMINAFKNLKLTVLQLKNSQISPDAYSAFQHFDSLLNLDLEKTDIRDEDLKYFYKLHLTQLDLTGCQFVTKPAVDALRRQLPDLKVRREMKVEL